MGICQEVSSQCFPPAVCGLRDESLNYFCASCNPVNWSVCCCHRKFMILLSVSGETLINKITWQEQSCREWGSESHSC